MGGVKHWAIALAGLGMGASACTGVPSAPAAGEALGQPDALEDSVVDPRPLLPLPRPPTAEGCAWLDPLATGSRVREGEVFDLIAHELVEASYDEPALAWIQPARSPAPAPGRSFYAANAGGRLRWCTVDPDDLYDGATCEGSWERTWLMADGTASGPDPEPTARVVAMLDHAARIHVDPARAAACTPAPPEVLASIEAPAWVEVEGLQVLEFVEELRPAPGIARLVRVRAGSDVHRTELYTWNPLEVRR